MALKAASSTRPGSIAELDKSVSLYLHRHVGSSFPRAVFMLFEHSGNGILWLLLAPAVWCWSGLGAKSRTQVANFFLGLWIDIALVGSIKYLVKRPRPEYNLSSDFVLVVSVDKYSFPSGHAARVAFVAAYAMLCCGWLGVLPSLLVSLWAVSTAISRALMGRHYIGDVTAGLLLGMVTTALVTKGTFSAATGWLSAAQSEAYFQTLRGGLP